MTSYFNVCTISTPRCINVITNHSWWNNHSPRLCGWSDVHREKERRCRPYTATVNV